MVAHYQARRVTSCQEDRVYQRARVFRAPKLADRGMIVKTRLFSRVPLVHDAPVRNQGVSAIGRGCKRRPRGGRCGVARATKVGQKRRSRRLAQSLGPATLPWFCAIRFIAGLPGFANLGRSLPRALSESLAAEKPSLWPVPLRPCEPQPPEGSAGRSAAHVPGARAPGLDHWFSGRPAPDGAGKPGHWESS